MPAVGSPQQVERLTQRIGREMFDIIGAARPWIIQSQWWEERLLQTCTANERFKVQSFRFIDALPTLRDDGAIAQHIREYFAPEALGLCRSSTPTSRFNGDQGGGALGNELADRRPRREHPLVMFVSWASRFAQPRSVLGGVAAWVARAGALAMAGKFIAGSNIHEAVRAIERMRDQHLAFTIDVLGEAALSRSECEHYFQVYFDLIRELPRYAANWRPAPLVDQADGRSIPRVNVSVKVTSLFAGFDPIAWDAAKVRAKEMLRPLFRKGMESESHVHVDMEHYAIKDLTLEMFRELLLEPEFRDYPHFGIVLQAYLKDGERDARDMIAFAKQRGVPLWIRLVKGAYWDSETVWAAQSGWPVPVWEQKWQSDACYERVTHLLLENHAHIYTALGSHNVRSLSHGRALKQLLEVPDARFEWQMLYGMGDEIKRAAVELGQRCRVYTPYGEIMPGMAYLIRRLLENTANESFLRHSAAAETPVDELLCNPAETGARRAASRTSDESVTDELLSAGRVPTVEFATAPGVATEMSMEPFRNAPDTDFSHAGARSRMATALQEVRATFGRECPLIIGGRRSTNGEWRDSLNPSRPAQIVARAVESDATAADRAVAAALEAFPSWKRQPVSERAALLSRVAEQIEAHRFELAAILSYECAKNWREADGEVSRAVDYCRFSATEMIRLAGRPRRRDIPGEANEYEYLGRGVTAVIAPWNFPMATLGGMLFAAVVTGNTVVLKPAEQAPLIAFRLVELLEQSGLPPGVVNFLPGAGEVVGDHLVRHPDVETIAFTGSRAVGLQIHRRAAELLTRRPGIKRVIAEMGGKNAIIVDSDADQDEAIKAIVGSAFGYAGQKCSACSRLIVVEGVYEQFVHRLVEAARSVGIGPADSPTTAVNALIDQQQYDTVREFIRMGKAEARCLLEVDVTELVKESGGYYVGPVIFGDVPAAARIAREEIFGPVLAVMRARDIDHAVSLFNDCDYALTGGIFSRSPAHIERARAGCECGNFYINRRIVGGRVDLQPFGGLKLSGIGQKVGGPDYLVQYCDTRTVSENTLRRGFTPGEEADEGVI